MFPLTLNGSFVQFMDSYLNGSDVNVISNDSQSANTSAQPSACVSSDNNVFELVNFGILGVLMSVFGCSTNVLTIIVFVKLGLNLSVNTSLCSIAVSDFCALAFIFLYGVGVNPLWQHAGLNFDVQTVSRYLTTRCHMCFLIISACITAFVAVQRCICITRPFQVKTVFTPSCVNKAIITFFALGTFSASSFFIFLNWSVDFDPDQNRTLYTININDNIPSVMLMLIASILLLPFAAFIVVAISSLVLVVQLRRATHWRLRSASGQQAYAISRREKKVSKLVLVTSLLFIICFIPTCISALMRPLEQVWSRDCRFVQLVKVVTSFSFLGESFNSSVSLFVYYSMSSKFRTITRNVLGCRGGKM